MLTIDAFEKIEKHDLALNSDIAYLNLSLTILEKMS